VAPDRREAEENWFAGGASFGKSGLTPWSPSYLGSAVWSRREASYIIVGAAVTTRLSVDPELRTHVALLPQTGAC
jgi:hypothetical protein